MKKVCAMLCLLLGASVSFAQGSPNLVRWQGMAGVITAQGVDNPVSNNIHSGTFPWTVRSGSASVDLATGATLFHVEGLNINGAMFSGTPGPIPAVTGTLVCNPGTGTEVALDTRPATLSAQGDTQLSGHIANIPTTCSNPLFLLRIARLPGANGRWIATGTQRSIGNTSLSGL
jgi:hypothetical protein